MTRDLALDGSTVDELASLFGPSAVVILPTDTIYGLHARADDERGVQRIASIKQRDASKPFIILGSNLEQLEQAGAWFSDDVRAIVGELWPGPLTAIVKLTAPLAAARGATTVAVRVPHLQWLRDLIERTGPLASTSVNRSGEPALDSPDELSHALRDAVDAVVHSGRLSGKPSALVDFTGDEPRFIREGDAFFTQKVWKTLRKSL